MVSFASEYRDLVQSRVLTRAHREPPPGRRIPLTRDRVCFVREAGPAEGTPTVLLLHGWLASGGLNWLRTFESLAERYRLLAPDLRGHARGGPTEDGFAIQHCADDMAELLDALRPGSPVIVVGYSLGGMVAQELWRRHRDLVDGLVLSATSASPFPAPRLRPVLAQGLRLAHRLSDGVQRGLEGPIRRRAGGSGRRRRSVSANLLGDAEGFSPRRWAAGELARHHWPTIVDAGRAITEFDSRSWIAEVDVPTTVLLTERDGLVSAEQQRAMSRSIPDARVESVHGGHASCVRDDFAPRLLRSIAGVERRLG